MNYALLGWLAFWRWKQWYHRYTVEGLDRLLYGPPALIVGYHGRPLAYDVCMLTVALYDRLGYLPHGIVHRGVDAVPPLKAFFDALGFVTGDGDGVAAVVARGEHVVVTPGGAREGCRSVGQRYRVAWDGRLGYLRLALRHGLRIVPVAAAGADDAYVGFTDAHDLGRRIGLPTDWAFLPWVGLGPLGLYPFSPPFPVRMRQLVGDDIDPAAEGVDANDRDAVMRLHVRVSGAVQALLDQARKPKRMDGAAVRRSTT